MCSDFGGMCGNGVLVSIGNVAQSIWERLYSQLSDIVYMTSVADSSPRIRNVAKVSNVSTSRSRYLERSLYESLSYSAYGGINWEDAMPVLLPERQKHCRNPQNDKQKVENILNAAGPSMCGNGASATDCFAMRGLRSEESVRASDGNSCIWIWNRI